MKEVKRNIDKKELGEWLDTITSLHKASINCSKFKPSTNLTPTLRCCVDDKLTMIDLEEIAQVMGLKLIAIYFDNSEYGTMLTTTYNGVELLGFSDKEVAYFE